MKKIILIAGIPLLLMHCSTFFPKHSFNATEIHTTIGQEFLDLQQALDSGAITQEEYDTKKKELLDL